MEIPEATNEQETRDQNPETGGPDPKIGAKKPEAGDRKPETEDEEPEVKLSVDAGEEFKEPRLLGTCSTVLHIKYSKIHYAYTVLYSTPQCAT